MTPSDRALVARCRLSLLSARSSCALAWSALGLPRLREVA
jgi:hypothetical protein